MRVPVSSQVYDDRGRARLKSYDVARPPDYCCTRMADYWGDVIYVGLSGRAHRENLCVVMLTSIDRVPGSGERVPSSMPITHCPWCGVPIVLTHSDPTGR